MVSEVDPEVGNPAGAPVRASAGAARWARVPMVVDDLDQLRGPRSGVLVLPLHLEASTCAGFDFADPLHGSWPTRSCSRRPGATKT